MSDSSDSSGGTSDLIRWSEALAGCARTGLGFTASLFEAERFREVLAIAADIRAAADRALSDEGASIESSSPAELVEEWMRSVERGTAGYNTPRVAVGALVGNDAGELLLVQREDSGAWLYPTGWADVGYSAAEVAVKEVGEETGLGVEPVRLTMVIDGLRLGMTRRPLYSLVFQCAIRGGTLKAHPLECHDVGFFARDALPHPLAGAAHWVDHAFLAISGAPYEVYFERPRDPVWRRGSAGAATS